MRQKKLDAERLCTSIGNYRIGLQALTRSVSMRRLILSAFAILMLSGCSVLERVDIALERLDATNRQLLITNQQISTVSQQMTDTQASLLESNRLVVESNRQLALSISNVVKSNGKMDTSNEK